MIDLGFLRMEGEIGPGIDVERVATGKSVCVVREDHPLAALDEITVKDLRNIPLILIGRQRQIAWRSIRCSKGWRQTDGEDRDSHQQFRLRLCGARVGGNDHQQFYANLYRHLPVVARPFVPQATQEFGLARASGAPLSIAAQALSDALKREIQLSQKIV